MVLVAATLITLAVAIIALIQYTRVKKVEQENEEIRQSLEALETYFEMLMEDYELVRRYRHDLAGHIRMLEAMMEQGGEDLKQYRDILLAQHQSMQAVAGGGSDLINAVVRVFAKQCQKEGITFDVTIDSGDMHHAKQTDLGALLHNLLENAVEECLRMPDGSDKRISLEIHPGEKLYLVVKNTVRPEIKTVKYVSEKASSNHGIGNGVIQEIAGKYGGTIKDTLADGEFQREIRI